jgi:hypothetical protein
MKLSIVGCPDKERFRPYVKAATKFYAEELISKKLLENIFIQIKFNKDIDVYGYASIEEFNDAGKPREFMIELNPNTSARDILDTIAHEMVHVKQYVYGETNENLTRWKGVPIDSDKVEYYSHPWEIEAYGMAVGLFTKFAIKECLWEVFEGIRNPAMPIRKESLGWKNFT